MASTIVDELVTLLGLETDPKAKGEASAFGKILGGVVTAAAAAGAALTAAATAVGIYAATQAEAIDKSAKMAESFGINFQAFQELEYAAQQSGAEVEEFRRDLENLSKTLDDNDALKELGVSAKDATGKLRSTDAVLMDIATKFETLSKGDQNKFNDQLTLSPSALKLLQQGGKGLQALRDQAKALGIVLDDNAKNKAARFQSSLLNARSVVDALGKSISVGLLPAMADSLDIFTKWIGENKNFISSGIKQVVDGVALGFELVGKALSYAYEQVERIIGPFEGFTEGLDATQAIGITVAAAIVALGVAAAAAVAPFVLIGGAIAAVILVLDDLYSAFTGGESVIGAWFEQFKSNFPGVTSALANLVGIVSESSSSIADDMITGFKQILAFVFDVLSLIVDSFASTVRAIEKIVSGANPFTVLPEMFKEQLDIILNFAGKYADKIVDMFSGLFGGDEPALPDAPTSSAPSAAPMSAEVMKGGGSATQNNTNTFNINGAGDPAAVANEVVKKGGLGQTLQQSSPGLTGPVTG